MTAAQESAIAELREKIDRKDFKGNPVKNVALSPFAARTLLAMIDTPPT